MTNPTETALLPASLGPEPEPSQAARFTSAFRQENPQALAAAMQLLRQHNPQAHRHPGADELRLEFPDGSSVHLFREQGQLLLLQGCTLLQTPLPPDQAGPQEAPPSAACCTSSISIWKAAGPNGIPTAAPPLQTSTIAAYRSTRPTWGIYSRTLPRPSRPSPATRLPRPTGAWNSSSTAASSTLRSGSSGTP